MSTRSIIGYNESARKWKGVYHHWDGYPSALGVTLLELAKEKGTDFIRKEIVEAHPAGWSTINRDWSQKPLPLDRDSNCSKEEKKPPEYYKPENEDWRSEFFTEKDEPGTAGSEYLYLITKKDTIAVYTCKYVTGKHKGQRMIGMFGMGAPDIGRGKEVKWVKIGEFKISDDVQKMADLEK